jgi:hypothetical protein
MPGARLFSRRNFLIGGVALVTGGIGVGLGRNLGGQSHSRPPSTFDDDGLAIVGRAYLAEYPAENDLRRLTEAVPALRDVRSRAEVRAALPEVSALAALEFASGDVVHVHAWRLALSEARAAAVVALLAA